MIYVRLLRNRRVHHSKGFLRFASTASSKVLSTFPRAVTNTDLVTKVSTALKDFGYGPTTLLATSLCVDEVSRQLERDFSKVYGPNFSMGGLSGFPFGGVTSFGAMAAHIPDGGDCLIVYGPHVGVDRDGVVGKTNRRGQCSHDTCCGSACAAAGHVHCVHRGETPAIEEISMDPLDSQQAYVNTLLQPYAERLAKAPEPMVELPMALYDAQKKMVNRIVEAGSAGVKGDGKIALLGGIQVNTPHDEADYFMPMDFLIRDNKGELVEDLLPEIEEIQEQVAM